MNGAANPGPPARLVVLGIDAASPLLLEQWISDGTLPNLRSLVARGVSSRVRGIEGFFVGSTWPSMYTGTNPASHGVHYLTQLVPGTYDLHFPAEGAFVQRPAFWKSLSDAGQRVAVLDVPLTRLDRSLRGVQVVEWGGHDSVYGFRTHPAEIADDILARFGPHPVGATCDAQRPTAADYIAFVERLEDGIDRKEALSREVLKQGGWDLFMQVFTEAHCAGHQCWHLHDTEHPAHDAGIAAIVGDPLKRVYRRIDAALGRLIEAAGDTQLVVYSAHGMAHWYGATFLLPDILLRLGASVARPPVPLSLRARVRKTLMSIWKTLPQFVRAPVRRVARGLVTHAPPAFPTIDVDVTRSRCFVHRNGLAVGGIRLNLAGREPHGLLQPGAEADAFVDWLTRELMAIVDTRTGKPLVSRVVRTASLYSGEHRDVLPDLLVEWSDAVPTGSTSVAGGIGSHVTVTSPAFGALSGTNEYSRTGEHRPDGWMVAAGPGIANGAALPVPPHLIDLAPTLTEMLGVTLDGCDGSPVAALLRSPSGASS